MKKLLFMFVLVFYLFVPNVKAYTNEDVSKPFVCTVGYDYSCLLEYDGYEIISKAVDFYNVGTYYITYLNKTTRKTITKRIDVINENSILENGYYRSNKTSLSTPDYHLIDSFTFNETTYLLEEELLSENKHNFILTKVENSEITFTKTFKSNVEASLSKLLVDEEGIYILGTIYKEGYSIDLYALNIDFSFNIVFENTIGGSGVDNLEDAVLFGNNIYIVGNTTSSGGYFSGVRKAEDSFVMSVTKDLFNVNKVVVSTIANLNTYTNITLKDNNIYVFEQHSNNESVSYNAKVYSTDLNIIASKAFINSHAITPYKLVTKEEGVFLICFQYNYLLEKYATRLYQIDEYANSSLYYDYTNYEDENLRIIDINFNQNELVILAYDYNYLKSKLIIKNLLTKEISTLSIDSSEPLKYISNDTYITLTHDLINYIYINGLKEDEVIINNEYISLSNKSKITNSDTTFGQYTNLYIYESNKLMLGVSKEIYIPVNVSVLHNELFDKNLTLTFNGEGYLNGKKIESGYVIDTIGEYQLELFGSQGERKVYQFKVEDLSTKDVAINEVNNIVDIEEINTSKANQSTLLYGDHFDEDAPKTYYFFLLLIPLILLVGGLILIFRRKHEK